MLNLCQKELSRLWKQKRVQPSANPVSADGMKEEKVKSQLIDMFKKINEYDVKGAET